MDIIKNGIRIQSKEMDEECGECGSKLILGVYRYYRTFKKVAECEVCGTAIELEPRKRPGH